MHELEWFSCSSAFGATPRPALAYPYTHSLIFGHMAAINHLWNRRTNFGATTWPADHGAAPLYKRWCTGVLGTLLFLVALVPRQVLVPSTLFALVSLQVHTKKKKNISFLCIFICTSFAFRVYLLLFARTCLWWYYYPARTILWCIITRKNDFVECYHPQEWFLWEATMPCKDY